MTLMLEHWKPVIGYEKIYEISNVGNIRNRTQLLRPGISARGYYLVCLGKYGTKRTVFVHRLLMETFVGPLPGNHHTNHKSGWKLKNWLSNLEYVTAAQNARHACDSGNYGRRKLSPDDIRDIRCQKGNRSPASLAKQYGVAAITISNVLKNRSWRNIK